MSYTRIWLVLGILFFNINSVFAKTGYYEIFFTGNLPDSLCYFSVTYKDILGIPKPKNFILNSSNKIELKGEQQIQYLIIGSKIGKKEGILIVGEGDKIRVTITSSEIQIDFSNADQLDFFKDSETKGISFSDFNKLNIKEIGIANYINRLKRDQIDRELQISNYSELNTLSQRNKTLLRDFSDFIFYQNFCLVFNECIPFEAADFLDNKVLKQDITKKMKILLEEDIFKYTKFANFNNLIHNFSRGIYIMKSNQLSIVSNEDIRYAMFDISLKNTKSYLKDISLTSIILENISDATFCNFNLKKYYLNCSSLDLKEIVKNKILSNQYIQNMESLKSEMFNFQSIQISWEEIILKQEKAPFTAYFWASWCASCIKKIPVLVNKNISVNKENIIFINIDSAEENWRSSKVFSRLNTLNNNYHLKPNSLITKTLDIKYLPRAVLFNSKGHILKPFYFF